MDGVLGVLGRNAALIYRMPGTVLNLAKIRGEIGRRRNIDFQNYRLVLLDCEGLSALSARIRSADRKEHCEAGGGSSGRAPQAGNEDKTLIREGRREDRERGKQQDRTKPKKPPLLGIFLWKGFASFRTKL